MFVPSVSASSFITWDTKTLPLSDLLSVRKYACLVMMAILNFAGFIAVELEIVWANAQLENTSISVIKFP